MVCSDIRDGRFGWRWGTLVRGARFITVTDGAVSLCASGSASCNATAHATDFIDIVNAIRLFLGDELIEMAAEGGGGEVLVAVGALFVLGGRELGRRRIRTVVIPRCGFIARVRGCAGLWCVIHGSQ